MSVAFRCGAGLSSAVALLLTGGCGTIYAHDPKLEAATAKINTDFKALKAPAYLEAQQARAIAFGVQEDAAVAALATSARDVALIDFIRPSALADKTRGSANKLLLRVDEDLGRIYKPGPWGEDELSIVANAYGLATRQQQALLAATSEAEGFRVRFNASKARNDKRKTGCADVGPPPVVVPAAASNADRDYIGLQIACQSVALFKATPPGVGTVIKDVPGELGQALRGAEAAEADIETLEKDGRTLQARIKALQEKPEEANTAEPLKPALTKAQWIIEKLKSAPAVERQLGLEAVADTLEPALARALASDTALPADASKETVAVSNAITFVQAVAKVGSTMSSAPRTDQGQALLITVAELKHQQAMATLEANAKRREARLLRAQATALSLQAEQLVRAHRLLVAPGADPKRGFAELRTYAGEEEKARLAEAIAAYATAWDVGETPYWVLKFKAVQDRRLAALQRAQRTEADTRAVIAPALDALEEGGRGGVKKDTWLTLLGHLSIAGAILGK